MGMRSWGVTIGAAALAGTLGAAAIGDTATCAAADPLRRLAIWASGPLGGGPYDGPGSPECGVNPVAAWLAITAAVLGLALVTAGLRVTLRRPAA